MRLLVAAIGRMKKGPERELADRYRERAAKVGRGIGFRDLEIVEVAESRSRDADRRKLEEAIALRTLVPDGAAMVALDERGASLSTTAFSDHLQVWRDAGRPACAFLIGGADGLAPNLGQEADLRLAFGSLTWPHQLVRVLLLEQLYRVTTVLSGHPYHRE